MVVDHAHRLHETATDRRPARLREEVSRQLLLRVVEHLDFSRADVLDFDRGRAVNVAVVSVEADLEGGLEHEHDGEESQRGERRGGKSEWDSEAGILAGC